MSNVTLSKNDQELLCEIKRNLDMCAESTTMVIKKVDDKDLMTLMTEVIMKVTELSKRTTDIMHQNGIKPEEFSKMKQLSADIGIMVNTLFDSSDSHIAEMMVRGLEMGVVSLREFTAKQTPLNSEVAQLCIDVADMESTYAHKIGQFVDQPINK